MFTDGSTPVFRANASAMQRPTLSNVRIGSTRDALQIFYAVAMHTLPMTHRRLDAEERRAITTGNVYVWEERGANSEATGLGIERWTDGMRWSPSRVRDDFLFYHQKELDPDEAADLPPTRWARTVRPRTSVAEGSEASSPTDAVQARLKDPMRLIKQTYSVNVFLPEDRLKGISRKWHLTAYFTQATVNELRKVEDVLNVPPVPEGLFQSARSGKQRHSTKTTRSLQFANNFMPEAPLMSPVGLGVAGPSGLNQTTQLGTGQEGGPQTHPQHLAYMRGRSPPQYSPYRGQDEYGMQTNHRPTPPQYQSPSYSLPYNGAPYAHAAHLQHPPLPPPPSMPQYNAHSQSAGVLKTDGREREYDETMRREEQQYTQYRKQQQSPQTPNNDSISILAVSPYISSARPIAVTSDSSPKPGHPYANALHMRPQRSGSVQGGRPSEYHEPTSTPNALPENAPPVYMAGPSGGGSGPRSESDGPGAAGGGVYRTPHSHSHAHVRHRSSPVQSSAPSNAILPHYLPLPPSPPAPMSHLGATGACLPAIAPMTMAVTESSANPASGVASGGESASDSPSASTAVSSAHTIAAPTPLPAISSLPLASAGIAQEKERALVPLGNLKSTNIYRRRDPTDDALLRRFNGLRTTPPAHVMEG